jgi:TonB family protein
MHPILLYLLKMLLCSGILYGYYRAALYNERFHQWNRFYLLGAMLLSIVVPLIEIPLIAHEQTQGLMYVIETLPATIVAKAAPLFSTDQLVWGALFLVSLVLLLRLVYGLYLTIYKPYSKGEIFSKGDIDVIITETPSAPYSFFRLLFWRSDMDPDSPHGKRVLLHELTHIREKHSADKLFVELLLVVYWFNPFFWLIRKELYVIHEFLADRKAIEQNNGAAFAEMILQTMNAGHLSPLTNPFFSSHLKRRLKMITTSKKPQFSYLRRISALVAMVTLSFVLMLTIEKGIAQQAPPPPPPPPVAPPLTPQSIKPDQIESLTLDENSGKVWVKLKDKTFFVLPVLQAQCLLDDNPEKVVKKQVKSWDKEKPPVIIYAGLEINQEQMAKIDPSKIDRIEILKGDQAVALYGERANDGVIKIIPKLEAATEKPIIPTGKVAINPQELKGLPHIVINQKKASRNDMERLRSNEITSVYVLQGNAATQKYGDKASDGAIEITTRTKSDILFTKTENMPIFPGGQTAWTEYLQRSLRYPSKAIDQGVQGLSQVSFIVNTDGSLEDFKIVKDPGYELGNEAKRILEEGPKWEPGTQNGKIVRCRVVQTITFRLE